MVFFSYSNLWDVGIPPDFEGSSLNLYYWLKMCETAPKSGVFSHLGEVGYIESKMIDFYYGGVWCEGKGVCSGVKVRF